MNTENSLINGEIGLLELTDAELVSVCGGRALPRGYNFGGANQSNYSANNYYGQNGAFANAGGSNSAYGDSNGGYIGVTNNSYWPF